MSNAATVPVVIRSHNDLDYLKETLARVLSQSVQADVHVYDNDSDDGTVQFLKTQPVKVHRVAAGSYVPGVVLNWAMQEVSASAPLVVFLNSDCTPLDDLWLETLLAGFDDPDTAAVFGRQMPRPDCMPLFAKDTEDTFGDGSRQQYWRHCFSMASSAIRTSVWQTMPFREDIQYSEDIDWTWRARQQGKHIVYMKDSKVYHSHNYTLGQFFRRQYGEGKAEANIFEWSRWERSTVRYSILPFLRQVKSDWGYAVRERTCSLLWQSPLFRGAQMIGRKKGFHAGIREKTTHG